MKVIRTPALGGTFFAATTSGLYRMVAGGNWTQQSGDPSYMVSDVVVDPTDANRIYISLGFAGMLGQHRGGVRLSTDNGTTFNSITSGLSIHQAPIASLQVDPVDHRYLNAAVYGLGGWTYHW
jgi:hypothetical protein